MAMPTVLRFGGNRRNGDRKNAVREDTTRINAGSIESDHRLFLTARFLITTSISSVESRLEDGKNDTMSSRWNERGTITMR